MTDRKRTINMLVEILPGDEIWMYLKDREICRRFYEDAEAEGFMFGDIKPTDSPADDIIVVHSDHTLGHPGFAGHMGFYQAFTNEWIRVDYAKYITGDKDFYIRSRADLE